MALVYNRSSKQAARRYERSAGMEPNVGVSTLTVVGNPGRPERNPFQWIEGRGQRHRHASPAYRTVRGAASWKGRASERGAKAKLYPVDEYGSILTRPLGKKQIVSNRRTSMSGYNPEALRRALHANRRAGRHGGVRHTVSARGARVHLPGRRRMRGNMSTEDRAAILAAARGVDTAGTTRKSRKSRKSGSRKSRKSAAPATTRRAGKRRSRKSTGRKTKRKAAGKRRSRKSKGKKAGKRRSRKSGRRRSRKSKGKGYFFHGRSVRRTGREYIDKYVGRGYLPAIARSGRLFNRPSIFTYPIPAGTVGRLSTRRSRPKSRKRSYAVGASYGGARGRHMAANGRRRRRSRKSRGGRRSGGWLYANRRRSRRRRSRKSHAPVANRRRRRRSRRSHPMMANRRRSRRSRRSVRANRRRSRRSRKLHSNQVRYVVANRRRRRRSRRSHPMMANRRRSRRSVRANRRRSRRNPGVNYVMAPNRRRSRRSRRNPNYVMAPNRRRSRRSRRNPKYVVVNRRRSRRSVRANRRRSRRSRKNAMYVTANRRSRRNGRRRSRKNPIYYATANRRRSRRRRSLRPNMLATSKIRYSGRGGGRMGRGSGKLFQLVEFGPHSKGRRSKSGRRRSMRGYPVLVPPHVSMSSYVRRFRFGGAAKDAHRRRMSSPSRERRSYPKRRVTKNRRRSMRRNAKYVVANRRRSRRSRRITGNRRRRGLHRNIFGTDVMKDVLVPVAGGTVGFVAARLLSNGLSQVAAVRNVLDASDPTGANTKLAANALGILATLGLGMKVPMIKRHQGALVTGMGLALADRLLGRVTGPAASYLGEYFEQPMGEYFEQPLGAYVLDPSAGVGEYFEQPVSGLGDIRYATAGLGDVRYATAGVAGAMDDPANQDSLDALMDVAEAAAGVGIDQAAAGYGGLGQATIPPVRDIGFRSTVTPTDVAANITKEIPYTRPVETSLVTPEGKGFAAGIFGRHLFGAMLAG